MKRPWPAIAASAACFFGTFCPAGAAAAATDQDARVSALEQKLERSLKLIEQLTARVQELEGERTGAAASPAQSAQVKADVVASPQTQQRLDNVEQQLTQLADASAVHAGDETGLPLHGFADVGVGNHNSLDPSLKGADVGALDMYLNPQLGEHTRALFELTFEVGETGEVGVDLERAQLGYQFGDAATVWLGRFHTPFGYYNTAFHHGQQIATSLRRPRFILFEDQGGIMPNHTVGAWLTGAERLSAGQVMTCL